MKRFKVVCGDLNSEVKASSYDQAFVKLIREKKPEGLGMIAEITELPDGEPSYILTNILMDKFDLWEI